MPDASPGAPRLAAEIEDRLNSWKEIAAYLSRDVTTVQRWEKREGMPVHRHLHDRMGSVSASRAELDAWVNSRKVAAHEKTEDPISIAGIPEPGRLARQRSRAGLRVVVALAALIVTALAAVLAIRNSEHMWRNPIANARFSTVTEFDGVEQAAAISRDGKFIAFISDRDGHMDVWLTQAGSGQFHNLTRGLAGDLVNPEIRTLGFSPDGAYVTYWVRSHDAANGRGINIWAAPILGGQPSPYLEGAAELDWSHDGSRVVYHTPAAGDPTFVSDRSGRPHDRRLFVAPAGSHCHFPLWAPDSKYIYFVQGSVPDKFDIWRIAASGGTPERITSQNTRISHPVLLDRRTLLYLATDSDGSGPWLFSIDVEHRIPHRLSSGLDRYTSLAASADGRRLVVTRATPKRTLWRLPLLLSSRAEVSGARISLTTGSGRSPRLGPDCLVYVSPAGSSDSIWKISDAGASTELWSGHGARVIGGPAVAPDGRRLAFSLRQDDRTVLYTINMDGTNARIVTGSLRLQGEPAWAPDGQSITVAAEVGGMPRLFRVPVDGGGRPTVFVTEHSEDPAWAPSGQFVIYSGPDIGTSFSVKAVNASAAPYQFPALTLPRGARRLKFLSRGNGLVFLRGDLQHKNLWLLDPQTGRERQLTNVPADVEIRDFDISRDGSEVVVERIEERSDIVLLNLPSS